jgi:ring-1,2-phenylacetyl-CoA epoxidase subunit PaaC|tara:strand:+ start:5863 stop:6633 length:771 start_codon:yes stop_codon:yes gene_type:complete
LSQQIDTDTVRFELLLQLGDNALILGHRLSEWSGDAPVLEEDVALTNIALDLIGQARFWLTAAGKTEGLERSEDDLAYHRDARDWRNLHLVELPNGDFAQTMLRQYFFDTYHLLLLEGLAAGRDSEISGIAAKAVKEVRYHLRHSRGWVIRLGDGTKESRARMQQALEVCAPCVPELFEADMCYLSLVEQKIAPDIQSLKPEWQRQTNQVLDEATLEMPEIGHAMSGGRQGLHSEQLGYLLAEMQFLQRAYPGVSW